MLWVHVGKSKGTHPTCILCQKGIRGPIKVESTPYPPSHSTQRVHRKCIIKEKRYIKSISNESHLSTSIPLLSSLADSSSSSSSPSSQRMEIQRRSGHGLGTATPPSMFPNGSMIQALWHANHKYHPDAPPEGDVDIHNSTWFKGKILKWDDARKVYQVVYTHNSTLDPYVLLEHVRMPVKNR
jgi:hypothetical protein